VYRGLLRLLKSHFGRRPLHGRSGGNGRQIGGGKGLWTPLQQKKLKAWVVSTWGESQSPSPQIQRLSRGWFLIIFSEAEQASRALSGCWTIDSSPVLLKLWDPTFDASSERMDSFPIWVLIARASASSLVC
jgi:hypothetical protein